MNALNIQLKDLAGMDFVPCVSVHQSFLYVENKRSDQQDGVVYQVLLQGRTLRVKVEDNKALFTQEELDAANTAMTFKMVSFKGLKVKFYTGRNGQQEMSATADEISIAPAVHKSTTTVGGI